MKKFIVFPILFTRFTGIALGQSLSQTVRGTVVDVDTKLPINGAEVILLNSEPLIG